MARARAKAHVAPAASNDTGAGDDQEQQVSKKAADARLDALAISLSAKRQKAIDARVSLGIDQRWFEDTEAYEGRDELTRLMPGLRATVQGYVQQQPDQRKPKRSTIVVNVTRSKVNAAAARLQDIVLPSDDRNWDLRPSTVPALVGQLFKKDVGITHHGVPLMINDGQKQRQVTVADLASQTMEEAKKRAEAMRDEIDDQLDLSDNGCGYEGVVRQVIDNAALLGVGIIKGPVVTSRTKKVWLPVSDGQRTLHKLSTVQDLKPMSSSVDPWDFYPAEDCGETVKKGSGTWERMRFTAKDLRDCADIPGYLVERIKQVLIDGPREDTTSASTQKPNAKRPMVDEDTIFTGWEYHGQLDREDLLAAGVEVSDKDVLRGYNACVLMVNNVIIKADIELLDTGELPYDVFVWEKASGIWAGYGVAYLARSAARVITAGWRAMLDNAGQTIGAQTVVKRESIEPADGQWELSGRKLWFHVGDEDSVEGVFKTFDIPSNQKDYEAIIMLGLKFLDEETSLPMLAQGERGTAPDRVGVATILINSANTVLRKKLKNFDDQLSIPHIGRYVDWNMQYSPRDEIKGDMEVQARASGALLERDIQNQWSVNLLNLAKDPAWAAGMKKWPALRRVVQAGRFSPDDFVHDDETIKQNEDRMAQNAPPISPDVQAKIEADKAIAQMKVEDAKEERAHEKEVLQMKLQLEILAYADKRKLGLEQVKAQLAEVVIKERGANARFAATERGKHIREQRQARQPKQQPRGQA
jgi:hypothetical protein